MKLCYRPKKRLGMIFLLSFSLLFAGITVFAMTAPLPASYMSSLLSVLASGLTAVAFIILWRFGIVSYEYYVVDRVFYVVRILFGRRYVICDLSLSLIRAAVYVPDGAKQPPQPYRITRIRNFTNAPLLCETMQITYGTSDTHLHRLILQYHKDFFEDFKKNLYTDI